jgi:hypothetical protein
MFEQGSSTDGSLLDFEGRIATESLKKIQNKETQENSSREIWLLTFGSTDQASRSPTAPHMPQQTRTHFISFFNPERNSLQIVSS